MKKKKSTELYEKTAPFTLGAPLVATNYVNAAGDTTDTLQISQDQFDTAKNQIFLMEENEDLLKTVRLLGEVSNRLSDSGPLPGTQKIETHNITGSGTTTFGRPAKGTVWQLQLGTFIVNSGTGSNTIYLAIRDKENGNVEVRVHDGETLSSGRATLEPNGTFGPVYLDENCELSIYCNPFNATSIDINVLMSRVR